MKVHEKIKLLRQMKGWTQEEVAGKLEMSANGYGSIERGETDIGLSRLEKIADVFDVDLTKLVDCGNKIVYNQTGDNYQTNYQIGDNTGETSQVQLKYELEKKEILLAERDKEIKHLEEIICLLKQRIGE